MLPSDRNAIYEGEKQHFRCCLRKTSCKDWSFTHWRFAQRCLYTFVADGTCWYGCQGWSKHPPHAAGVRARLALAQDCAVGCNFWKAHWEMIMWYWSTRSHSLARVTQVHLIHTRIFDFYGAFFSLYLAKNNNGWWMNGNCVSSLRAYKRNEKKSHTIITGSNDLWFVQ